jgi:hypothetical protein
MDEESYDPTKAQVGDNPKHKQLMAWKTTDDLGTHEITYHHGAMGFGSSAHNFMMHDSNKRMVGSMGLDHDGTIQHIEVHEDLRRQGLATKLYKFGHELHEDIDSIPAPKHSESRTESGDAWARAVGGVIPKEHHVVEDHDFRSRNWESMRDTTIPALKSHLNEFHAKMIENGMDDEGNELARHHVESAHDYLDSAAKVGPKHPDYSTYMYKAHGDIDELGEIHSEWYGNMYDHEKLQEHIGKMY